MTPELDVQLWEDDGVPDEVPLRAACSALRLHPDTVRRMADSGALPTIQPNGPRTKRFVTRDFLEGMEANGWPVDWLALIEALPE